MRLTALALAAVLVPNLALAVSPLADKTDKAIPQAGKPWVPAPQRLDMYGAASHSPHSPRMTPQDAAAKRAERALSRTPRRSSVLVTVDRRALQGATHAFRPLARTGAAGTFTAQLLERSELDPDQIQRADEMEDYLDDTLELTAKARTPGVRFTVKRKADIRESMIATPDYHTQLEVDGHNGGPLELDLMMPTSGHHGQPPRGLVRPPNGYRYQDTLIPFRDNARADRLVLMLEHPDGTQEQLSEIAGHAYGKDGDLQRGDYVTTLRLRLDNLQVGETRLSMVPEFTMVGGFANGRTISLFKGVPVPPSPPMRPDPPAPRMP